MSSRAAGSRTCDAAPRRPGDVSRWMRSTRRSMPFGWSCACGSMPSTSGGCAAIAARSSSRDSTLTARMLGVGPGATLSRVLATRTFLFSDLRDYTRFVERHGDIAAASLISEYRRIVRAEVARHEGSEVKTEGDSFYIVFNTTGSAVTCAAAILREAERYSRQHPDRPMRIGVGIHAGEPVPHEGPHVGSAVIVAARLAQGSQAGALLVTEVVRQLLPRSLTLPMEERAGLTLKGLDAPPRVYAVDWHAARPAAARSAGPIDAAFAAAMPSSQQVLSPIVIGRDRELASLE